MSLLEKIMGPPMAAPETPRMRTLRIAVIGMAAAMGAGLLGIRTIIALCGPVATGAIFAALVGITILAGSVWLLVKTRRDNAWLDHLVAKGKEP